MKEKYSKIMQMNKISVIVPCYNSESYLNRCISSLCNIKSKEIEFVFVNDGSTDKTVDIISSFQKKDSRVKLFSKQNGGYSSAINFGIDHASGEYLTFMGSDDELDSNNIDILIEKLDEKADLVFFSTTKVFDDGHIENDIETSYIEDGFYNTGFVGLSKATKNDIHIVSNRDTSRLYKRDIIGETRYYGKSGIAADGCFAIMVASKAKSFHFIRLNCYKWYIRKDSVYHTRNNKSKLEDEFLVWEEFYKDIKQFYQRGELPKSIVRYFWYYWTAYYHLRKLDKKYPKSHYQEIKKTRKWIRKSKNLSNMDRLSFMFPHLFLKVFIKKRYH